MKCWILLLVVIVLGFGVALGAPEEKVTYYVQLIRGNDDDQPPSPNAKPIGPRLSKSLRSVFRWKNYWEINRRQIEVVSGTSAKVVLSQERAVEINLSKPLKRSVTTISNNKPVCSTTQPVGNTMTIVGADRDKKSAWFVVVRRDKPSVD